MKKVDIRTPETHLVTVYTVNDSVQAELIRNTLEDHGIRCELGGEFQAGFTGALDVEVIVRAKDAKQAAGIIEDLYPNS